MRKLKVKERAIAAKLKKFRKAQKLAEYYFALADRRLYAIARIMGEEHGRTARISLDGRGIILIDKFKEAIAHPKRLADEMPKAWGHGAVRQFEIKEVPFLLE